MLNWLKALFQKDEAETVDVPFYEVICPTIMDKVYNTFGCYVLEHNQEPFQKIIKEQITEREWENIFKVLDNLKLTASKDSIVEFLDVHCYGYWFPRESVAGREFKFEEKNKFARHYIAQNYLDPNDDYSEEFIELTFQIAISRYTEMHKHYGVK